MILSCAVQKRPATARERERESARDRETLLGVFLPKSQPGHRQTLGILQSTPTDTRSNSRETDNRKTNRYMSGYVFLLPASSTPDPSQRASLAAQPSPSPSPPSIYVAFTLAHALARLPPRRHPRARHLHL